MRRSLVGCSLAWRFCDGDKVCRGSDASVEQSNEGEFWSLDCLGFLILLSDSLGAISREDNCYKGQTAVQHGCGLSQLLLIVDPSCRANESPVLQPAPVCHPARRRSARMGKWISPGKLAKWPSEPPKASIPGERTLFDLGEYAGDPGLSPSLSRLRSRRLVYI